MYSSHITGIGNCNFPHRLTLAKYGLESNDCVKEVDYRQDNPNKLTFPGKTYTKQMSHTMGGRSFPGA